MSRYRAVAGRRRWGRGALWAGAGRRVAVVASAIIVGSVLSGADAWAGPATPGQLSVLAGTGAAGAPIVGNQATASPLNGPNGIAYDAAGNLYIVDSVSYRVVKVSTSGVVSVVAGDGSSGTPVPGPATSSPLGYCEGIAVDSAGTIYIGDLVHGQIDRISTTGVLSIFAGNGSVGPAVPGPATASPLYGLSALAVDAAGDVFATASNAEQVDEITPAGTLSVVAGSGASGSPVPGPATQSPLASPQGVVVDGAGNVYIADATNNVVEKVTPAGVLSVLAGTGTAGAPTNGPATASDLDFPDGLAVDAQGSLYISDASNNEAERVTGGVLTVIAGDGTGGTPTVGVATSSPLSLPRGIAVTPAGTVAVANNGANEVVAVTAGTWAPVYTADTPPTATYGQAYSYTYVAAGRPVPTYAVTAGALPAGLSLNPSTGVVSGTPTGSGTFTIGATNSVGAATTSATLSVVVPSAPVLTADAPPAAAAGTPYSYTFVASGVPAPTFSVGSGALPAGLTLDPVTGVVSGTPTASGTFTIVATNSVSSVSSGPLTITVASPVGGAAERAVGVADTARGAVVVTSLGNVWTHATRFLGSPAARHRRLTSSVVGVATVGHGYVVATAGGNVYNYGTAFLGSPHGNRIHLVSPVVGVATVRGGYAEALADGTVYVFTAHHHPTRLRVRLASVVGLTADGSGLAVVNRTGTVLTVGAVFHGSVSADHLRLGSDAVGIAAVGSGYVVVTADGRVFAFGAAGHAVASHGFGSPVVGVAGRGGGYRLVTADGRLHSYRA